MEAPRVSLYDSPEETVTIGDLRSGLTIYTTESIFPPVIDGPYEAGWGRLDYCISLRKEHTPMDKYETLKADMTTALKEGKKLRRLTIADMVASYR